MSENKEDSNTEQQPVEELSKEENTEAEESELIIPVSKQSIIAEFKDFIIHNKAWWLTPIVLVLLFFVAIILFAESAPVLPFIYTVL